MYQTPQNYPEKLSFSEAEEALKSVNETLKQNRESPSFLVKWEGDQIELEFGEF